MLPLEDFISNPHTTHTVFHPSAWMKNKTKTDVSDWQGSNAPPPWLYQDLNLNTAKFMQLYAWYSWPNVVLCFLGGFLLDRVFGIRYKEQWVTLILSSVCLYYESERCVAFVHVFSGGVIFHCFLFYRLGTIIFSLFVCVGQVGLLWKLFYERGIMIAKIDILFVVLFI